MERARTLANAIREHAPDMVAPLGSDCEAAYRDGGVCERVFAEEYAKCDNISIDYAVLEPRAAKGEARSGIYCLPADFGWNDLGFVGVAA